MEEILNRKEFEIYKNLDKPTLKIILFYLENKLLEIFDQTNDDKQRNVIRYAAVRSCIVSDYNYLELLMNTYYRIDLDKARNVAEEKIGEPKKVCRSCKLKYCIKYLVSYLLYNVQKIKKEEKVDINPEKLIKSLIGEEKKTYNEDKVEFSEIDIIELLHIEFLLKNKFIKVIDFNDDTNIIKVNMLNLYNKENTAYYVNKLYDFYNNEYNNEKKYNITEIEEKLKNNKSKELLEERLVYYTYLMDVKNINVLAELTKYLDKRNLEKLNNRSKYFSAVYFKKVDELPCNSETKKAIKRIFNYVLNYYFSGTPYIPLNIVVYTEDRDIVARITSIIGKYMWFFGYLKNTMKYYEYSMNEIISNHGLINQMFWENNDGKVVPKYGMLTITDFQNVIYRAEQEQNMILNLLAEKILKNNSRICTVIYGNKETIKNILDKYPMLSTSLFNIELNIDELRIDEVYKYLIEKLETTEDLNDEIKDKLYNYIKLSYGNSEIKNTEYAKVLYNKIILNKTSVFDDTKRNVLKLEDIPNLYNVRDLPEILADLNGLVGLKKIKEQINDLISLLKFNKKANIDISNFNLHMVFTGNPGTGKTTVARLLSDILYNLGYTKKNKLVEVSAKDLIAEYVGQTAGKTYNVLKSALGGVLFIDEAYSIVTEATSNSFANDCMTTILKVLEDQKNNLIVIFAGYEEEMETFIKFNPGLKSRIGYKIKFDDYTKEELIDIFKQLVEKDEFKITEEALNKVDYIIQKSRQVEGFGNARYINKMYQDILIAHSRNLEDIEDMESLKTLTENDIIEEKLIVQPNGRKIGF